VEEIKKGINIFLNYNLTSYAIFISTTDKFILFDMRNKKGRKAPTLSLFGESQPNVKLESEL